MERFVKTYHSLSVASAAAIELSSHLDPDLSSERNRLKRRPEFLRLLDEIDRQRPPKGVV